MSGLAILDSIEQSLTPSQVDIHSFAEGSNYANKCLYPRQVVLLKLIFLEEMTGPEEDILTYWIGGGRGGNEVTLSPNIRERRDFLRENGYKHFREVQMVGGRRSSKGFVIGLAMAYVMYGVLMLGDPGTYYGIDKEKDIYFSCIAGSESQAKEFQYADLVSTVENCKAFNPYLVKSLETEFRVATNSDLRKSGAAKARGSKIQRDIAKLRGKALAANAGTLRGSATMVYAMDEMAHMLPGESKASAESVYTAADPSLDQFGLDGMGFLSSSPFTKVGMFYECYEANLRPFDPTLPAAFTNPLNTDSDDVAVANGNPRNFAFRFPSWALFQDYRKYSSKYKTRTRGKEFGKMITVSPDWDPEELDDGGDPLYSVEDKTAIIQARAKEAENPESYKVERRGMFAEVSDAFLNPSMVDQMYRGVPDGFESMPNGDLIRRYRPIVSNHGQNAINLYKYKFHIDPSSTTAGFGFAIAHIEYFPDSITGLDQEHVVFDLIKRWDPKNFQGKVIRWKPILDEITTYATMFRPFEITMDQHQSGQPIQDLTDRLTIRDISCRVFMQTTTNESNWKRWEVFKTALYQGLIHAPYDEEQNASPMGTGKFTSKDELKFLQQITTGGKFPKIEKQDIGPVQTRDMSDCIAECVYTLIGNLHIMSMRERLSHSALAGGSPGGYGIGQGGPIGGPGPPGISAYYSRRDEKLAALGGRTQLTRGAIGLSKRQRGIRTRGR
jgi:hypothetical protein